MKSVFASLAQFQGEPFTFICENEVGSQTILWTMVFYRLDTEIVLIGGCCFWGFLLGFLIVCGFGFFWVVFVLLCWVTCVFFQPRLQFKALFFMTFFNKKVKCQWPDFLHNSRNYLQRTCMDFKPPIS